MAPRSFWKGHIRLSLVVCPVRLYSALDSSARLAFHQIHEPTGKRVRQQLFVPDVGPVDRDEIIKGYEISRNRYVTLTPEQIESVKIESEHTLNIVQFVERHEIHPLYFDKPYYVAPDGKLGMEAYVVLRDALRESKKTALGQIVLSGKERIAAMQPCGRGIILETLRYADEVKKGDMFFDNVEDIDPDQDQLELAESLMARKTAPFDASQFEDRYSEALREMIDAKVEGHEEAVVDEDDGKPKKGGNVVNLMDALKASLEKEGGSGQRRKSSTRSSPSRRSSSSSKASGKSSAKGSTTKKASNSRAKKSA